MQMLDIPDWQKLIRLIGEDRAAALSAVYGGGRLFVPRFLGAYHPITETIGKEAAALLVAEFGQSRIDVPMMLGKRAQVLQLRDANMSVAEICRRVGVSRRFVFYVFAEDRDGGDEREPDLFD